MVTFFSTLLILLAVNVLLLVVSVNNNKTGQKNLKDSSSIENTKIYPLNIIETKYNKAV